MFKLIKKIKEYIFYIYMNIAIVVKRMSKNKTFSGENYRREIYKYYLLKYKNHDFNSQEFEHKDSNIIWWCWLQGEINAPELCKACLNSVRKNATDKNIIVITKENYMEYATFPEFIIEKWNKGIISNTHFSDLLRLELLIEHGGTWIDSSVLMTKYEDKFFNKDLFVFKNWKYGDIAYSKLSSWFITAFSNNALLIQTRDMLFEYWKKHDYLIHYFLFHILFSVACEHNKEYWSGIPLYPNIPPHVLQFEITNRYNEYRFSEIEKMSSIHKLTQKANFSKCDGETVYDYIIRTFK